MSLLLNGAKTITIAGTEMQCIEIYTGEAYTFPFAFTDSVGNAINTTGWTYTSTVYNPDGEILDILDVTGASGLVTVTAPASVTENWGTGYRSVVSELQFDVQVTIPSDDVGDEDTIWTPVIGYISVLGDVSSGGLS